MFIDIIAFALLCLSLYKGLRKGFVVALFSFFAFVIGIAAAIKLSSLVAVYLGQQTNIAQRWLPVLAFVVVFFVVVLLVRLGAKLVEGAVEMVLLGWVNKLAGVLLYVLIYFFIFSILLFYATQLQLIKPAATDASYSYAFIAPLGPQLVSWLGAALPFLRNMFDELLRFFEQDAAKTTG